MRYLIRTSENGRRLSEPTIDELKQAAIDKIIMQGHPYVEHSVLVGSKNAAGEIIEEMAYVIEAVTPSAFHPLPKLAAGHVKTH